MLVTIITNQNKGGGETCPTDLKMDRLLAHMYGIFTHGIYTWGETLRPVQQLGVPPSFSPDGQVVSEQEEVKGCICGICMVCSGV